MGVCRGSFLVGCLTFLFFELWMSLLEKDKEGRFVWLMCAEIFRMNLTKFSVVVVPDS